MTPELWLRLKPLFHEALDRDAEDRDAFIAEACGADAELKENLVRLVQAAQQRTRTLDDRLVRFSPPPKYRFRPGETLLNRFRIVRPIGCGGMGEVYEAEDLELGRVALKTIRDGIASSSDTFNRFRHEVQLARKVTGAQVCRIHELYLLPASGSHSATAFLTMEYLDGITLAEKLNADGPLPLDRALKIALDVCEGLRLVHGEGMIHRDLKSANIMVCSQGVSIRAVLMDFGLARDFSASPAAADDETKAVGQSGTLAGAIMGTPAYMAPEQFEAKPVSPSTDIYALGVVLYELITGLHPFAAPTPVAAAIRRAQRPAPPSSLNRAIPRKWDRVIQRCLQYEPADRFQSADDVAAALSAGRANLGNLQQDRPWIFRIVCAAILVVIAWGAFTWWQTQQYYHPNPESLGHYNDGLALIRQGNYAEATRLLDKALKEDQHFVMAHARMAEALYNLDFQGSAEKELLIALPGRSRLPPLDGMYLDAIQATVTGDFSNAIQVCNRILRDLPDADKSSGYVDLGMAYQRAGDVTRALEMFARAAALNSDNPASYMHTGILQSRLHHIQEGDEAFDRAFKIFQAEIDSHGGLGNPEGLAELDYERGYAANDRGDLKSAAQLLQQSLEEARRIPSVQLEIRAHLQLSSVESETYQHSLAVKDAEEAIRLARDNQLDSWAASGLVRLANAHLVQLHLKEAEEPLEEAMQILRRSPQPRPQALANSTLASLMNQEHHPEKVAEPAQAALDFYEKNGFSDGATTAGVLLIRAERDKRQYKEAIQTGKALLALAKQSSLPADMLQVEEVMGTTYLAMEQYPDALEHSENARLLASTDLRRSYPASYCAEALSRLGRYAESEAMLGLASQNPALSMSINQSRVELLLSQQKYTQALGLAQQILVKNPDMQPEDKRSFERFKVFAEAHLGMKQRAQLGLLAWFPPGQEKDDPEDTAQDQLTTAEIYLWLAMNQKARDAAQAAEKYFASTEQPDSALRSALLAAAASQAMKDEASRMNFAKIVIDIERELRHTWGPEPLQTYLARPDIRTLTQHIPTITR